MTPPSIVASATKAAAGVLSPSDCLIACVSGGKDSTALALWLEFEAGLVNPREYVFCDTGHEHPLTLVCLDELAAKLGRTIHRVVGPWTFIALAEHKKRFPSSKARFCTEELKVRPLARWIEERFEDAVVVQGVRAEESAARAALPEWQPRGAWHGHKNFYDCPIWRPILRWTTAEAFACAARHGVPPNPLYKQGARRVGCWPCIMSSKGDLRAAFAADPGLLDRLRAYEARVAAASARGQASIFGPNMTPRRFHDRVDAATDVTFASIDGVHRWATAEEEPGQGRLFHEEPPTCMSQYGLCE